MRRSPIATFRPILLGQGLDAFQHFQAAFDDLCVGDHKGAHPLAAADQPLAFEGAHGLTQGGARNAQGCGQFRLGRQAFPRRCRAIRLVSSPCKR